MTWPHWLYRVNDPNDKWWGDDKGFHAAGAAAVFAWGRAAQGPLLGWALAITALLLVEAIEVRRWLRWQTKGAPPPWPFLTDQASLKDVGWGLIGALVMSMGLGLLR